MTDERGPAWARTTLWIAAVYNLAFGAFAVLWPSGWFELGGMDVPDQLYLWQCIGMIVGVYGIGYACAAVRPLRHWPIVLVGLLGKVLGPIGFLDSAMRGVLPWSSGWLIVSNDLIWWIPFTAILVATWRLHRAPAAGATSTPAAAA
ncbi:MAG: alkyl hydroperoxide reductase [Planctomycetota bacterium]